VIGGETTSGYAAIPARTMVREFPVSPHGGPYAVRIMGPSTPATQCDAGPCAAQAIGRAAPAAQRGAQRAPSGLRCLRAATLALLAVSAAAWAQEQGKEPKTLPPVTATAVREPVEKSYRKMIAGMELFEKMRSQLAPQATLRFKLLPRRRDTNMEGIVLEILGDTVAIPVAVAADRTFTLERNQKALEEDASVTPNRRSRSMTWRTEIRTPGLPAGTRRLGDLRLECLVGLEADLISNMRPLFGWIVRYLVGTFDYCNRREPQYLFFAERALFGVTLIAGSRKEAVAVDRLYAGATADPDFKADLPYCDCEVLLDRTYFLPLGDRSWPNDTLVVFEYMDDGDAARAN